MVEKNKQNLDIINFYEEKDEKFSRFFGESIQVFQLKKDNYSLQRQIKLIAPNAKETIVDAGCGYGRISFKIVELYDCKVYAFNITKKHIDRIKESLYTTTLSDKFILLEEDYNQIHNYFKNQSINKIFFIESFNHTDYSNKIQLLQNCYKVLKNGGEVFIQDFFFPETDSFTKKWKKYKLRKKISLNSSYYIEDLSPFIKAALNIGFEIKFLNKIIITTKHLKELNAEGKIPEVYGTGNKYYFFELEPYEIILRKPI